MPLTPGRCSPHAPHTRVTPLPLQAPAHTHAPFVPWFAARLPAYYAPGSTLLYPVPVKFTFYGAARCCGGLAHEHLPLVLAYRRYKQNWHHLQPPLVWFSGHPPWRLSCPIPMTLDGVVQVPLPAPVYTHRTLPCLPSLVFFRRGTRYYRKDHCRTGPPAPPLPRSQHQFLRRSDLVVRIDPRCFFNSLCHIRFPHPRFCRTTPRTFSTHAPTHAAFTHRAGAAGASRVGSAPAYCHALCHTRSQPATPQFGYSALAWTWLQLMREMHCYISAHCPHALPSWLVCSPLFRCIAPLVGCSRDHTQVPLYRTPV